MWQSEVGVCSSAALVHAMDAVRGRLMANFYLENLRAFRPVIGSISKMAEVLRQMKAQVPAQPYANVQLQWLKNSERQAFEDA